MIAPAARPAEDKPYEFVRAPDPAEPRPLMSGELGVRFEEPRQTAFKPGPMAGDPGGPLEFLRLNATPEELGRFRGEVEARLAKDPKTQVFMKCDRCGMVMKLAPACEGDAYCMCNSARRTDGSHFRVMTDLEINEHLFKEATREKAEAERDFRAALFEVNQRRGQQGLAPFTADEFRGIRQAERRLQNGRDRELGRVAALCRRRP